MAAITIKELHKSFGPLRAVDGLSLNVEEGEIFGFLGPNGAGKTTTISCMLGLLKPDHGEIVIKSRQVPGEEVELKRFTGYVPSDPYFYPHWSGQEHMDYVEELRGKADLKDELISELEFDQRALVRNLSTGNKQKLALILAMMHSPQVLILDEPTRGLDPLLQNRFYKRLRKLSEKGSTIFMSSHNLAEVEAVCSRVAIIKSGKLVEVAFIKSLQQKRMHLVNVEFAGDKLPKRSDLEALGIEVAEKFNQHLELKVAGDLNPLLKMLSSHNVQDLTITRASLEDIFLEFYK